MPIPPLVVLGRPGDFLGAAPVRHEALALLRRFFGTNEEVECLLGNHITGH